MNLYRQLYTDHLGQQDYDRYTIGLVHNETNEHYRILAFVHHHPLYQEPQIQLHIAYHDESNQLVPDIHQILTPREQKHYIKKIQQAIQKERQQ